MLRNILEHFSNPGQNCSTVGLPTPPVCSIRHHPGPACLLGVKKNDGMPTTGQCHQCLTETMSPPSRLSSSCFRSCKQKNLQPNKQTTGKRCPWHVRGKTASPPEEKGTPRAANESSAGATESKRRETASLPGSKTAPKPEKGRGKDSSLLYYRCARDQRVTQVKQSGEPVL